MIDFTSIHLLYHNIMLVIKLFSAKEKNMEISIKKSGKNMVVKPIGRLDSNTAPEMEKEVLTKLDGITDLQFDLSELKYMSSAGLRIILSCQKKINSVSGTMVLKHVNDLIMEILEATGFKDIVKVEND